MIYSKPLYKGWFRIVFLHKLLTRRHTEIKAMWYYACERTNHRRQRIVDLYTSFECSWHNVWHVCCLMRFVWRYYSGVSMVLPMAWCLYGTPIMVTYAYCVYQGCSSLIPSNHWFRMKCCFRVSDDGTRRIVLLYISVVCRAPLNSPRRMAAASSLVFLLHFH